jgi:hypothetical protein
MGDAKFSFTSRAMTALLSDAGFAVEHVFASEPGKIHDSWKIRIFYALTAWISRSGWLVSPGLIYLARKI